MTKGETNDVDQDYYKQRDEEIENLIREYLYIGAVGAAMDLVGDINDPTLRRELSQTIKEY